MNARRVWRYQRGNQNPQIEGQTTQWPEENGQKDKQQSTKHTHKTKDRVTRTPLKPVPGIVSNYFTIMEFYFITIIIAYIIYRKISALLKLETRDNSNGCINY